MKLEIRNNFDSERDEAFGIVSKTTPFMVVLIDATPGYKHVVNVLAFEDYGDIVDHFGVEEFDSFEVINLTGDSF